MSTSQYEGEECGQVETERESIVNTTEYCVIYGESQQSVGSMCLFISCTAVIYAEVPEAVW